MTPAELKTKFPHASESFIRQNCSVGLRAGDEERAEGKSLERSVPREETCRTRITIRFTVYAKRAADWDAYDVKWVQDLLVNIGVLPGDDWAVLQGEVRSEKVHKKEEERTEIEIVRLD